MKRIVYLIACMLIPAIGAWAQTVTEMYDYENPPVLVGTYTLDGTTAIIEFTGNGNTSNFNKAYDSDHPGITTLIVKGKVPSNLELGVNNAYYGFKDCTRMDFSEASGNIPTQFHSNVKGVVLPSGKSFSEVTNGGNYIIIANSGDSEENAVEVCVKSGTDWANDPIVQDASHLKVYGSDGTTYLESDEVTALQSTKWVNGSGSVVTVEDLTIHADTQDEVAVLNTFLENKQIKNLTVDGELTDLTMFDGVSVAKDVNFSGITNSDLSTLKLPTTTGTISLPGGSYKDGVVTLASGYTDAQFANILAALSNSGLTVNSIVFPGGSTFNTSTKALEVSTADEDNNNLSTIATQLRTNYTIDSVHLEKYGTTWADNTMTLSSTNSAQESAQKTLLENAGFTVTTTKVTNYPDVEVTVDANGVVTITSYREGALEEMLNGSDDEATTYKAIINADSARGEGSQLVLNGPFNAADLTALTNLNNQTESVDMRNTTFSNDADAKFTYWDSNTLKTVYMSNDPTITTIPEAYFQNMKNIENLYIGESVTTIPEYRFQSLTSLKYVSIPSSVVTIGQYAFNNCTNLTDIDWSDNCNVKTIGKAAFAYSGYKGTNGTFTVPNSVERIEENAFERCNNITTLIFDTGSNISYIGKSAFAQDESVAGTLSNVYVNVQPARQITCERGAFDKFHTCAQTQVGTVTTRLHYPSEYYDYYVGNYKATLYDQNNDVKNEDGTWALDEHGQRIHSYGLLTTQYMINEAYAQATNGWQEFMSSGIPVGEGSLYRTYSDDNAYLVPNVGSLQIFLVHNYDKDQNQAECIQMIEGDVIPVNTGIIVHSNVAATIYLTRATDQTATPYNHEDYPDNKYTKSGQQYNNYLKPINGSMHIDNVEIVNGTRTYRNYFFNNGTTAALRPAPDWNESYAVKGWGFFRAGTADYTVWNKAFLHLPAAMTVASSTIIDDSGNLPQDQPETTSPAKSFGLYIIGGPEHVVSFGSVGIATAINKPVTEVNDGVYYTIQGVKVDKPTQNGIYIHNGKKVVVK